MNRCTRVRALSACSGDVHVARVVVHAVVGLTLGLMARVVVVVFVVVRYRRIPSETRSGVGLGHDQFACTCK